MKKLFILGTILCSIASLFSNEIKTGHDYAQFALTRVRFLKNGWMVLQQNNKMYAHGSWNLVTPAGYYSFAKVKDSLKNPSNGVWEYTGTFPADKEKNTILFRQSAEINPFGLLDVNFSWKSKNPKGNKASFYNLVIAMKDIADKDLLIGKERFKIQNIQKYGVFNKVLDNVELTFFAWDEKRCFKILCSGKVQIVGICTKDKNFAMRIYPAEKNTNNIAFSFTIR